MNRIPKIIHCCWFGSDELPDQAKKCMDSWRSHLPDYEICVWNERNIDFSECPYAVEAFEQRKWAFLSDYIRLKVLSLQGGIYLDTDVEVLKSFDPLLLQPAFIGFESPTALCTAVIGAEKESALIRELVQTYLDRHFVLPSGELDYTTNVMALTKHATNHWGLSLNDQQQFLRDGIALYPSWAFSPIDYQSGQLQQLTESYCIHHFTGSWLSPLQHKRLLRKRKFAKFFGKRIGLFIDKALIHISWRIKRICSIDQA